METAINFSCLIYTIYLTTVFMGIEGGRKGEKEGVRDGDREGGIQGERGTEGRKIKNNAIKNLVLTLRKYINDFLFLQVGKVVKIQNNLKRE